MNVHYLQHVPFENLGSIETMLKSRGHRITASRIFQGDTFPLMDEFDWLIVMGGPMGAHDDTIYPWLEPEKNFIRNAIDAGKIILGICLGAQLIAAVLGAKVTRNRFREIGWFPIAWHREAGSTLCSGAFSEQSMVFHWHGDTFDIPARAVRLASSKACSNQAFLFKDRVMGLQFHLETTPESARLLLENCRDELDGSNYVQEESEILSDPSRFTAINSLMESLLERLEKIH